MEAAGELTGRSSDESLLVERVQRGDRAAFAALVDQYWDQAYAIAYGFLQQPEDSEDLVQDAFIRALERIDSLGKGSPFGAWFYRVLVNAALNRRKYLARRRTDAVPTTARSLDNPSGNAERAELRRRLWSALKSLPEVLETVVVLHDLEGFKHAEIARVLGIPEGTSRSHLSKARRMLRERLGEYRLSG